MGKTKKAITKRLKMTKTGKIMRRRASLNHFLAKKSNSKKFAKKTWRDFSFNKTVKKVIIR